MGGEQQEYTYLFLRAAIVELIGEVKDCWLVERI